MLVEISVAVNYLLSHLYTKLPRRRVDSFGEELEKYLHAKFQNHWFPADPLRDAAFRCLNAAGPQVDLLLPEAAAASGLEWAEIQACLPDGLVITVDPGHVACQYHQPSSGNQDLNRSSAAAFWPTASKSLSSSGCSSASSSISSANLTPTSTQLTHQVLYCLQDNWMTSNNQPWYEPTNGRSVKSNGTDNLATAAALSVLIDSDDRATAGVNNENTNPYYLARSLWSKDDPCEAEAFESGDFQTRRDYANGLDNTSPVQAFPWHMPDNQAENAVGSLLNGESQMVGDKISSIGRSFSNPPQMKQLGLSDLVSSTVNNVGQPIPTDHQSLFPRTQLRQPPQSFLSPCSNTSVNQFGQKSVSTPSFTAATFAQTKFGSTKLKSHSKRNANRLISPTNVQQTFTAMNAAPMLHREPLNSNGILNGQRTVSNNNSVELSAFRRFMPSSTEEPRPGQQHLLDALFHGDAALENGHADAVLSQTLDGNHGSRLLSLIDRRFVEASGNAEDPVDVGRLSKYNLNAKEAPAANYWPLYNAPGAFHDPVNGTNDEQLSSKVAHSSVSASLFDWSVPHTTTVGHEVGASEHLSDWGNSRSTTNAFTGRTEEQTDFSLDESLLSTRMVNLLLEEESEALHKSHNETTSNAGGEQIVGEHAAAS